MSLTVIKYRTGTCTVLYGRFPLVSDILYSILYCKAIPDMKQTQKETICVRSRGETIQYCIKNTVFDIGIDIGFYRSDLYYCKKIIQCSISWRYWH